jgi:hypothetical protein
VPRNLIALSLAAALTACSGDPGPGGSTRDTGTSLDAADDTGTGETPDTSPDAADDTGTGETPDTSPDAADDTASDTATDTGCPDLDGDGACDADDPCPLDNPDDLDGDGACGDRFAACRADFAVEPAWPVGAVTEPLDGRFEWAQSHVVAEDETRIAPRLVEARDTLVLFTPGAALDASTTLLLSAWRDGRLLGTLSMAPPSALPTPLEQDLTPTPLAPYSTEAWSALVEGAWFANGVTMSVGHLDGTTAHVASRTLSGLGSPHRFTITRSKIVLFGDASADIDTRRLEQIARQYFGSTPYAELRLVDSLPWRVDEIVVKTAAGPQLVTSESERTSVASDTDHWSILKNQMALRLNLANTGRGLALTAETDGDSSPYAFGTSLSMGWFKDSSGAYEDIDDAPWAAGWTGWTAMWAEECGNGFIHEVGHSYTLAHFTEGTAASWGIADEYPNDGVNLPSHPWGYDTAANRFRTWYRVDTNGPVTDGAGGLVGKRDPMNGGEDPNAVTCYPQYTAYHARKIQAWAQSSPTILEVDGRPGIYTWDDGSNAYAPTAPEPRFQRPVAVDVPVLTLIGTLTATDAASRLYPPIRIASGNVFDLPSPTATGLDASFNGGRWFVEVDYADGSTDRALIARGAVTGTTLALFSLNLDARRDPVGARLYRASAGYPTVDPAEATLVHQTTFTPAEAPLPPIVTIGRGALGNGTLQLTRLCDEAYDCAQRAVTSTWRIPGPVVSFSSTGLYEPQPCALSGDHTELALPVINADGETGTLIAYAQRVVMGASGEIAVPIDDATPWWAVAGSTQSIRVWLPWSRNSTLGPGLWRLDGPFALRAFKDGVGFTDVPFDIELELFAPLTADVGTPWSSPSVSPANSSAYFLLRDPAIGPTSRVWWDDGGSGPTLLRVPVVDTTTGAAATLIVNAQREECTGARSDLHAGRGAVNCDHRAVLWATADANPGLVSGRTYRTLDASPVVFEGRRWHAPEAQKLLRTFAVAISWTRP